jgi:hypothetical protein
LSESQPGLAVSIWLNSKFEQAADGAFQDNLVLFWDIGRTEGIVRPAALT